MMGSLLFFTILLFCGLSSAAPGGKEFATVFMQNYIGDYEGSSFKIEVASPPSAMGPTNVKVTALGKVYEQTVNPGKGVNFDLPKEVEMIGSKSNLPTVLIEASQEITVLSLNYKKETADTSVVYPVKDWGTEYYIFTPRSDYVDRFFNEFSITNYKENNVGVQVFLRSSVTFQRRWYSAGSTLTIDLKPFESVQIQSKYDLSGSRVISNLPVGVLSGHSCTQKYTGCNHVYEQLQPVKSWGKQFIVPPLPFHRDPYRHDSLSIQASQFTLVQVSQPGIDSFTLPMFAGQKIELYIKWPNAYSLTADNGIQVLYEYNGGDAENYGHYDPFMFTILPVDQFSLSYSLEGQAGFSNMFVMVALTSDLSGFTLDKAPLPINMEWNEVEGTNYSWGEVMYGTGSSFLEIAHAKSPFAVYSIGVAYANGYGSPASGNPEVVYGKGVCTISGDPHYKTFDEGTYDFQGTCTYTAATGCNLEGTSLKPFSVVVENEKWYAMSKDPKVSVAKLVAVEVYGNTLVLRRNEIGMIMVNGIMMSLPINLNNGAVQAYQDGTYDVIVTDFGLRVTYDLVYHVTVTLPAIYRGKTCGLCGNFNGNSNDEFQLPNGQITKDVTPFGAAWKVSVPGVVCEDGCSGDLCPKCNPEKKQIFQADCSMITDPKGPFAACHNIINPASYFRDCVYDVCLSNGDRQALCHSIGSYMIDCQDFGVTIGKWRSPNFCPLKCPANSHYESCAETCGTPCPGLTSIITCPTTCAEGCSCNAGYLFNGTGCVQKNECSCYHKGITYKIGESILSKDCTELCTCTASSGVKCEKNQCQADQTCQIKNGIRGCFVQKCLMEAGGAFTLFNGRSGALTASGAYEIIKVCDNALVTEWFRVVVKLQACGTSGLKSVVAIYVYFNGLIITVNNKQETWVNGLKVTLPKMLPNEVSLKVSDSTVMIERVSGLQVSYSLSQDITVTVSANMADKVCGACGKLGPSGDISVKLNMQDYMNGWIAPDFPTCSDDL